MANWTAITDAMIDWARVGSGLGASGYVELIHQAQEFPSDVYCLVDIREVNDIGEDQLTYVDTEATQSYEKVEGMRAINVRFWFFSFDQTPSRFALLYAERLRAASQSLKLQTILDTADVRVQTINETAIEDAEIDERFASVAVLSVIFHAAVCMNLFDEGVLEAGEQTQTIAQVELTSELDDEAGNALPASVQLDEVLVPEI